MSTAPAAVVRACLQAYVARDRAAMEKLVHRDYPFSSPLDNALDRAAYFDVCWPNSAAIAALDLVHEAEAGDRVFIVYEGTATSGKRFRNCELHTVRDGKLVSSEVYFGWDVPHEVPPGKHRKH